MKFVNRKALLLLALSISSQGYAAVALDRTRVIFDGNQNSTSVVIANNNEKLPYLAQSWIEDADGKKINSPLTVVPPLQRLEPGKKSQIRIDALPAINTLPKDRESLYYFNLREIPPRTDKPNTLQIALQTKVKIFYRPAAIVPDEKLYLNPWQEKMVLNLQGKKVIVENPTPYYITLANVQREMKGKTLAGFQPVMVSPFGKADLGVTAEAIGNKPLLTYINDYGGRPELPFNCSATKC
ncbi:fimbria/pilus periplasmic chaperone, partial [Pantoea endophytica]